MSSKKQITRKYRSITDHESLQNRKNVSEKFVYQDGNILPLNQNKFIINIECCNGCDKHKDSHLEVQNDFKHNFLQIQKEIKERYPYSTILKNHNIQPQIGAFEIRYENYLIWSKLLYKSFPEPNSIGQRIDQFFKERQQISQDPRFVDLQKLHLPQLNNTSQNFNNFSSKTQSSQIVNTIKNNQNILKNQALNNNSKSNSNILDAVMTNNKTQQKILQQQIKDQELLQFKQKQSQSQQIFKPKNIRNFQTIKNQNNNNQYFQQILVSQNKQKQFFSDQKAQSTQKFVNNSYLQSLQKQQELIDIKRQKSREKSVKHSYQLNNFQKYKEQQVQDIFLDSNNNIKSQNLTEDLNKLSTVNNMNISDNNQNLNSVYNDNKNENYSNFKQQQQNVANENDIQNSYINSNLNSDSNKDRKIIISGQNQSSLNQQSQFQSQNNSNNKRQINVDQYQYEESYTTQNNNESMEKSQKILQYGFQLSYNSKSEANDQSGNNFLPSKNNLDQQSDNFSNLKYGSSAEKSVKNEQFISSRNQEEFMQYNQDYFEQQSESNYNQNFSENGNWKNLSIKEFDLAVWQLKQELNNFWTGLQNYFLVFNNPNFKKIALEMHQIILQTYQFLFSFKVAYTSSCKKSIGLKTIINDLELKYENDIDNLYKKLDIEKKIQSQYQKKIKNLEDELIIEKQNNKLMVEQVSEKTDTLKVFEQLQKQISDKEITIQNLVKKVAQKSVRLKTANVRYFAKNLISQISYKNYKKFEKISQQNDDKLENYEIDVVEKDKKINELEVNIKELKVEIAKIQNLSKIQIRNLTNQLKDVTENADISSKNADQAFSEIEEMQKVNKFFVQQNKVTEFEAESNIAIGFFYKNPQMRRNFEVECVSINGMGQIDETVNNSNLFSTCMTHSALTNHSIYDSEVHIDFSKIPQCVKAIGLVMKADDSYLNCQHIFQSAAVHFVLEGKVQNYIILNEKSYGKGKMNLLFFLIKSQRNWSIIECFKTSTSNKIQKLITENLGLTSIKPFHACGNFVNFDLKTHQAYSMKIHENIPLPSDCIQRLRKIQIKFEIVFSDDIKQEISDLRQKELQKILQNLQDNLQPQDKIQQQQEQKNAQKSGLKTKSQNVTFNLVQCLQNQLLKIQKENQEQYLDKVDDSNRQNKNNDKDNDKNIQMDVDENYIQTGEIQKGKLVAKYIPVEMFLFGYDQQEENILQINSDNMVTKNKSIYYNLQQGTFNIDLFALDKNVTSIWLGLNINVKSRFRSFNSMPKIKTTISFQGKDIIRYNFFTYSKSPTNGCLALQLYKSGMNWAVKSKGYFTKNSSICTKMLPYIEKINKQGDFSKVYTAPQEQPIIQ